MIKTSFQEWFDHLNPYEPPYHDPDYYDTITRQDEDGINLEQMDIP